VQSVKLYQKTDRRIAKLWIRWTLPFWGFCTGLFSVGSFKYGEKTGQAEHDYRLDSFTCGE